MNRAFKNRNVVADRYYKSRVEKRVTLFFKNKVLRRYIQFAFLCNSTKVHRNY